MPSPHRVRKHHESEERKRLREMRAFEKMSKIDRLKTHRKLVIVSTILIALAIVLVAIYLPRAPRAPKDFYGPGQPGSDYLGNRTIQGPLIFPAIYNACTGDYRPQYASLTCDDEKHVFSNLPAYSVDMREITDLVWKGFTGEGGITDLRRIDSSYWHQPEFYPGWRGNATIENMLAGGPYWTPRGYGTYPWIRGYDIPPGAPEAQGTPIDTLDLFRSAFNVTHYQGVILHVYFPTKAIALNGTTIFEQDPAIARAKLDVRLDMSNDSFYDSLKSDPNFSTNVPSDGLGVFLVLSPTKSVFDSNWVVPLKLSIRILDATPANYVIAFETIDPNAWINQAYYLRYGESYVPSGAWDNPPIMQYILQVTTS